MLIGALSRPVHLMVTLDWVRNRQGRRVLEWACALLGWPVIIRPDGPSAHGHRAFAREERSQYLRSATQLVVGHLRSGDPIVIFPEGYPNVDPVFTLKQTTDDFLPFRPGFVRLVEMTPQ